MTRNERTDKAIHAIVEGRVQGVYFRECTRQEAERLGLTGWVRNRRDGSVEALIVGESGKVAEMVVWLHRGSPISLVGKVTVTDYAENEEFSEFTIRY
jgi:acylphosphatase